MGGDRNKKTIKKHRGVARRMMLALAPAAFLATMPAQGATQTWDPGLTTTGSDGAGTWDTTTANWAAGGVDSTYVNDGTTTPTFGAGGTVGNITLNAANLEANGINFTLGYVINTTGTDTITLTSPNVAVASGQSAIINAPLVGTLGLSVTGNLTLGQASPNFSGDVTVNPGATLTVRGANTNGSAATSIAAWAALNPAYSSNTETVGPYSAVGVTAPGSGNITIMDGASLQLLSAGANKLNFGQKTIFVQGTGADGNGAIYNPGAGNAGGTTNVSNVRQFDAFNLITLTGDALIGGGRMDIGRDGDPANTDPDKLDLAGHKLTLNMTLTTQPMFGIQAYPNGKGNNVGTTVTGGQIEVQAGTLDLELNANLNDDGSSAITFDAGPSLANALSPNLEVFKTDGTSCTRPMIFKGNNIIGPGAANSAALLASNLTVTGAIGFEANVSGGLAAATGNASVTLPGNINENGTASLSVLGNITVILSGTNHWSGGTNVGPGVLTIGSAGGYPRGTPLSFGTATGIGGGTFDLGGNTVTVSAINNVLGADASSFIGSSSTTAPSTLVYAGSAASPSTYAGVIADSATALTYSAGAPVARTGTQPVGVSVTSGTLTLTGANTYTGGTSASSGGTLIVGSLGAIGTGPLTVHAGGMVQLAAGIGTLVLPALSFDGNGELDLTTNRLVVEAAISKATMLAALQAAHGSLTSSTIAPHYAIAVIDNDNGAGGTRFTTFGGQSVSASSILIGPELLGDANVDGKVDAADLNTVLAHFGAPTFAWTSGNFDGASTIDLSDLAFVLNNFNATNPNPSAFPISVPAPEPASLAILGLGAAALATRRRKA